MEHSEMFENIQKWYRMGLWKKEHVHVAVPDMLTPEEYEEITGEEFIPDEVEPSELQEKADAFDILMGEGNE